MVELVAVLIIIGILAAVAIPRYFDRQVFDARTFSDQTQSMLRYAQKLAIAQNRDVFVRLDGSSIALCFTSFTTNASCAATDRVAAPAGNNSGSSATVAACGSTTWFCEAPPSGIGYTVTPATPLFYFNALGKPFNSTTTELPKLKLTTSGAGTTRDIFVEQETGYVHP